MKASQIKQFLIVDHNSETTFFELSSETDHKISSESSRIVSQTRLYKSKVGIQSKLNTSSGTYYFVVKPSNFLYLAVVDSSFEEEEVYKTIDEIDKLVTKGFSSKFPEEVRTNLNKLEGLAELRKNRHIVKFSDEQKKTSIVKPDQEKLIEFSNNFHYKQRILEDSISFSILERKTFGKREVLALFCGIIALVLLSLYLFR